MPLSKCPSPCWPLRCAPVPITLCRHQVLRAYRLPAEPPVGPVNSMKGLVSRTGWVAAPAHAARRE
eukprot:4310089-Alexandrium_andersonii.AAC.1